MTTKKLKIILTNEMKYDTRNDFSKKNSAVTRLQENRIYINIGEFFLIPKFFHQPVYSLQLLGISEKPLNTHVIFSSS